ncbi:MAG: beta-propeller domain-containing protein [Candidatus Parcubacteria bacterium]|nr:beta-propeller domain-containing protein [Candidatus Parcubacteria bacterium]
MNKNLKILFIVIILLLVVINGALLYFVLNYKNNNQQNFSFLNLNSQNDLSGQLKGIKKFTSNDEFKKYLEEASVSSQTGYSSTVIREFTSPASNSGGEFALDDLGSFSESTGLSTGSIGADRVSETNVQVSGIDEPDIVKTDGKEIYFSGDRWFQPYRQIPVSVPMIEFAPDVNTEIAPVPPISREIKNGIKLVKAYPPADLKLDSELEINGSMLLKNNILTVFSDDNRKIYGYDISDKAKPAVKWTAEAGDNSYILTSRLYQDKIYVITRNNIKYDQPCPYEPLKIDGSGVSISCTDIYHPEVIVPTDATFTVMAINPADGKVEKTVSFVGSNSQSIIYVSKDNIFVTYYYPGDMVRYLFNFFKENSDIVPSWVTDKLQKLQTYDLGSQAKMAELNTVMERWISSLNDDDRMLLENEMTNRMQTYGKAHRRELEQSGIFKIAIDGFKITANGSVPGKPLNQFSLDEYNGNLRVATTVGQSWFGMVGGGTSESANDVYVLDKDLKVIGSVLDLGLTERIYSARFIEDKGYVVTFRQTDPFYVIDLSNPKKPELKGELKIPGYSGYLHPINKDKIIGIGEENNKVKVAIFDVSNPSDPKELAKYLLEEYWSEAVTNHHAFLMDSKYEVFFLPGGKGGYVFSYKNDQLKLVKAVSDQGVKRALYLNDYLYIISNEKITVLNERDWEKVNDFEFYSVQ